MNITNQTQVGVSRENLKMHIEIK